MKFSTRAVHAGQHPDPSTGAIMTPIYQTSTYAQSEPGQHKGFEYSRTGNPTRTALEANLAALEDAKHGLCFASGLGATDTVFKLLNSGDHIVACDDLYGGTYRLLDKVYKRLGLDFTPVDARDLNLVEAAFRENTRMVWIETPTNPLLKIIDIEALSKLCKDRGAILVVDNTFATPYLQQPLSHGADLVVHSTTKYLGGHSDVVGGTVLTNDDELHERLAFLQNSAGAIPGPMDCFLVLRGTKTLPVRMDRHVANAQALVKFLGDHPRVERVYYPGLPDHPGHEVAKKQMRSFGGMLSFTLEGESEAEARKVVSRTKIMTLAESLGGVESLIEHVVSMTHGAIPPEQRAKSGLSDGLIRISAGIEDIEDLVADIDQALRG